MVESPLSSRGRLQQLHQHHAEQGINRRSSISPHDRADRHRFLHPRLRVRRRLRDPQRWRGPRAVLVHPPHHRRYGSFDSGDPGRHRLSYHPRGHTDQKNGQPTHGTQHGRVGPRDRQPQLPCRKDSATTLLALRLDPISHLGGHPFRLRLAWTAYRLPPRLRGVRVQWSRCCCRATGLCASRCSHLRCCRALAAEPQAYVTPSTGRADGSG